MVNPVLGAGLTPHGFRVVAAGIALSGADRLGHTHRGGVQVPGERTHELEHVRVALREVDGGGATHGQTEDGALTVGAVTVLQNRRKFLGHEGFPLVVLAVVWLLPVRVEGGFATHRQDHVDVLVSVELLDVGVDGPTAFRIQRTQAVQGPHLRVFCTGVGVPVTGQQDLYLNEFLRHGGGTNEQGNTALSDPLNALDAHTGRQPLDRGMLVSADRGALRHAIGFEVVGHVGTTKQGILRLVSHVNCSSRSGSEQPGPKSKGGGHGSECRECPPKGTSAPWSTGDCGITHVV